MYCLETRKIWDSAEKIYQWPKIYRAGQERAPNRPGRRSCSLRDMKRHVWVLHSKNEREPVPTFQRQG